MTSKGSPRSPTARNLVELLAPTSRLRLQVQPGVQALRAAERDLVDASIRASIKSSLNLDDAMRVDYPNDHRWDYLIDRKAAVGVIAVEFHSAKNDQVSEVIRKRKSALTQMQGHVPSGRTVARWIWIASGKVRFADTEREMLRLAQSGIEFVGGTLREKHLNQ